MKDYITGSRRSNTMVTCLDIWSKLTDALKIMRLHGIFVDFVM